MIMESEMMRTRMRTMEMVGMKMRMKMRLKMRMKMRMMLSWTRTSPWIWRVMRTEVGAVLVIITQFNCTP